MNQSLLSLFLFLVCSVSFVANVQSLQTENIVGGYLSEPGENTYQVFITAFNLVTGKTERACGGSILKKNLFLSIAHCFVDKYGRFKLRNYNVLAGTRHLKLKGIQLTVEAIHVYEDFNWISFDHDIAVLNTTEGLPVLDHPYLSELNLPHSDDLFIKAKAIISGFGFNWARSGTDENGNIVQIGDTDNKLRWASVRVLSNDTCGLTNDKYEITICGSIISQLTIQPWGVCTGDGGGALVIDDVVIGVLSSIHHECIDSLTPAKYTRVSFHLDFIDSILSGEPKKSLVYFPEEAAQYNPAGKIFNEYT